MTSAYIFDIGMCQYYGFYKYWIFRLMPGLTKNWINRRHRKLRKRERQIIERIGLATAGYPSVGETTICIAYMCPWAHSCSAATHRPAMVKERDCLRKFPEEHRPNSGLSDQALDNLAKHRSQGVRLGSLTVGLLDEFRPNGPTQSLNQKKPERPFYDGGICGKSYLPVFDKISRIRRTSK